MIFISLLWFSPLSMISKNFVKSSLMKYLPATTFFLFLVSFSKLIIFLINLKFLIFFMVFLFVFSYEIKLFFDGVWTPMTLNSPLLLNFLEFSGVTSVLELLTSISVNELLVSAFSTSSLIRCGLVVGGPSAVNPSIDKISSTVVWLSSKSIFNAYGVALIAARIPCHDLVMLEFNGNSSMKVDSLVQCKTVCGSKKPEKLVEKYPDFTKHTSGAFLEFFTANGVNWTFTEGLGLRGKKVVSYNYNELKRIILDEDISRSYIINRYNAFEKLNNLEKTIDKQISVKDQLCLAIVSSAIKKED